jgi:hypothetical protein
MLTRFQNSLRLFVLALASLLLLAGCATGLPGAGMPGGGYGSSYPDRGYGAREVMGTVEAFDASTGRLALVTEGYGAYGGRVEVWLDRETRAYYRGQQVDPRGLERGDGVRVTLQDDGRRLWARTIEVVRNVRESGSPYGGGYGDSYGDSGFEGAVRYVDLGRRVIEVTRGGYSGSIERVYFDDRTRFDYQGRAVRPEQLENGDVVRIQGRATQGGWYADTVWVTVSARSR